MLVFRITRATMILLVGLIVAPTIVGAVNSKNDDNDLYRFYLAGFTEAIVDALTDLADNLPPGNRTISSEEVTLIARTVLAARSDSETNTINELGEADDRMKHLEVMSAVYAETVRAVLRHATELELASGLTTRPQIVVYVERLLSELPITTQDAADAISYAKLIVGGSWIHTEESVASGKVTGELRVRTRLWDARPRLAPGLEYIGTKLRERRFIDLIVDARFLTNSAFTIAGSDSSSTNGNLQAILTNTRSSVVTFGLFTGWWRFIDNGVIGPQIRYQLSSLEGSSSVFRRLIVGLRIENRDRISMIRGASAEVGFTKQEEPSTSEDYDFAINLKRFYLTAEIPFINTSNSTFLISFNTEFPIGSEAHEYEAIYEFRIVSMLDPRKLLSAIAGDGGAE